MNKITGLYLAMFCLIIIGLGCKSDIPDGVNKEHYSNYIDFYKYKWKDYKLKNDKIEIKIDNYLGSKYIVIWKGDMDADNIDDYLIVKKHPGIHHGITRGMIIDDKGFIKMYIDINNGITVTKPSRLNIYDFKKLGIKKDEVKCIRILFTENSFSFNKKEYKERIKRYKIKGKERFRTGEFFEFELIDQNNNLIGIHSTDYDSKDAPYYGYFMVDKNHIVSMKGVDMYFSMMVGPRSYKKTVEWLKDRITLYRKKKAKGIIVKAINFKP